MPVESVVSLDEQRSGIACRFRLKDAHPAHALPLNVPSKQKQTSLSIQACRMLSGFLTKNKTCLVRY